MKRHMTHRGIESLPRHAFVMSDTRQLWFVGRSPTMALGLEENGENPALYAEASSCARPFLGWNGVRLEIIGRHGATAEFLELADRRPVGSHNSPTNARYRHAFDPDGRSHHFVGKPLVSHEV